MARVTLTSKLWVVLKTHGVTNTVNALLTGIDSMMLFTRMSASKGDTDGMLTLEADKLKKLYWAIHKALSEYQRL